MDAAKAFFQSAKTVTDVTPDRVTTDGHNSYPRANDPTASHVIEQRRSIGIHLHLLARALAEPPDRGEALPTGQFHVDRTAHDASSQGSDRDLWPAAQRRTHQWHHFQETLQVLLDRLTSRSVTA
jgi:hypothetical protein